MGKGFSITPVLTGLSTKWQEKEPAQDDVDTEIKWPLGEVTQINQDTVQRDDGDFTSHRAEIIGRDAYEEDRETRKANALEAALRAAL